MPTFVEMRIGGLVFEKVWRAEAGQQGSIWFWLDEAEKCSQMCAIGTCIVVTKFIFLFKVCKLLRMVIFLHS